MSIMLRFFRNIRQKLAAENNVAKYLRYAVGEILLVVIGILIALQVNNWNEQRKQRATELHYLSNLKNDLNLNIAEIEKYIAVRNSRTASANIILEYFEGKPLTDFDEFNRNAVNVYTWQKFFQIDNTFQELTNSGNLSIISNDSIKNNLFNLETLYKKLKYEEEHFRYDSEVMLYEPAYGIIDINAQIKNFMYQVTNGKQGEDVQLSKTDVAALLKNRKHKNGFAMATYEFPFMNTELEEMKILCKNIIQLIDKELTKE
jgi:hypothetical protein